MQPEEQVPTPSVVKNKMDQELQEVSPKSTRNLISSNAKTKKRRKRSFILPKSKKKNSQTDAQAKLYSKGFPTPLLLNDLYHREKYYKYVKNKHYNWAILGFGVDNFMSYAANFCKNEALNGTVEIISVGSGNGTVENDIVAAYQAHFGTALNITLVDKNPKFKVDYGTVVELIEKRPNIVGNCVLLIIWPEPQGRRTNNDGYDIDSIRKLQPHAVLTAYELTGISGSREFVDFLSRGKVYWEFYRTRKSKRYDAKQFKLDNYKLKNVAYQEVHFEADIKVSGIPKKLLSPEMQAYRLRMVKLRRIDC